MSDPIATGIAAGVTVEILRVIWDNTGQRVIDRRYSEAAIQARQAAEANARAYLKLLAVRMDRLERLLLASGEAGDSPLSQVLSDPDTATTVADSIAAAARTSDPGRHETIARLVAERLTARSESEKAAAIRAGVAIIERLSSGALKRLGLIALAHIVRPQYRLRNPVPPQSSPPISDADHEAWLRRMKEREERYRAWMREQVEPYLPPPAATRVGLQELVAAGCVSLDLLQAYPPDLLDLPPDLLYNAEHRPTELLDLWVSLMHAVLTPAGLVIGLAVHDATTGSEVSREWQWSATTDLPDVESIAQRLRDLADDSKLTDRIVTLLDRRLRQEARRSGDTRVR